MARRALWPRVRTAGELLLYAGLSLGALAFADRATGQRGLAALGRLDKLARLPERQLGQTGAHPALVRGTLHTELPRLTPSGHVSAVWYAWVEDVHGSGRNSYTVVVCSRHENTDLELHQAGRTARLDLLNADDSGALLKDGAFATLPPKKVALDFGRIYHSREIPPAMRERCAGLIPPAGRLTYFEAAVPLGSPVTVLGCATSDTVQRCPTFPGPPGVITVRGLRPVLHAYATGTLEAIRAAAVMVGLTLSLLASALFKLREAASGWVVILSWLDLVGTVLLFAAGLYHLRRGERRLRRDLRRWRGDPAALLTAVLGALLLGMGLVLFLYSTAFALISAGSLYR